MSDWTDVKLPCPQVANYSTQVDADLRRTTQPVGYVNQTRKTINNRRAITATYWLTGGQLALAELFLGSRGYSWFTTPLPSPLALTSGLFDVTVRLTSPPKFTSNGGVLRIMTLTMEDQGGGA